MVALVRQVLDNLIANALKFVPPGDEPRVSVTGRRTGTGGSAGVEYLDQTALRYRVFSDVWAVRSLLLRKPAVPPIAHAEDYGFRIED